MTEPAPRLQVSNLRKAFAGRRVVDDVSFSIAAGHVTCLLGPSGCGKSTILRMIAGIERLDHGDIRADGRVLSGAQTHLPPEARGVGLMFQDYALFPHLTVAKNVAYGLDRGGAAARERVEHLLHHLNMSHHRDAYPHELSGGEQQRVALARALAPKPPIMLMDEPFSGLDDRLRDTVRDQTLDVLKAEGTAVLLVTHEPAEAMRMADEIALMRGGQIIQLGSPIDLFNRPADQQSAAFFSDINLLSGVVKSEKVSTAYGVFDAPGYQDGDVVDVVVRPTDVQVADHAAPGHGGGSVRRARFMGHDTLLEMVMEDGTHMQVRVRQSDLPSPGQQLWLNIPADRCFVFARASGDRPVI